MRRRGSRKGMALPLLLFLLLALTLLAQVTLLLARREFRASEAFLQATRARHAAGSALGAGIRWVESTRNPFPPHSTVRILREELTDGLTRSAVIRWLSSEVFFLQGEGGSRGWPGIRRMGAAGWQMDPLTRLGAFQGGVEVGGGVFLSGTAHMTAQDLLEVPEGWEEDACAPFTESLDSLFANRAFPSTTPLPVQESSGTVPSLRIPGLGMLRGQQLLGLGSATETEQGSWEEFTPGEGCPGQGPPLLRVAEGSLTLSGLEWCGLLVVPGDLTLEGEGLFRGLILTSGSVQVGGSWRFQGMARVRRDLRVVETAEVNVSACPVLRTLNGIPALMSPILFPDASTLPLF